MGDDDEDAAWIEPRLAHGRSDLRGDRAAAARPARERAASPLSEESFGDDLSGDFADAPSL